MKSSYSTYIEEVRNITLLNDLDYPSALRGIKELLIDQIQLLNSYKNAKSELMQVAISQIDSPEKAKKLHNYLGAILESLKQLNDVAIKLEINQSQIHLSFIEETLANLKRYQKFNANLKHVCAVIKEINQWIEVTTKRLSAQGNVRSFGYNVFSSLDNYSEKIKRWLNELAQIDKIGNFIKSESNSEKRLLDIFKDVFGTFGTGGNKLGDSYSTKELSFVFSKSYYYLENEELLNPDNIDFTQWRTADKANSGVEGDNFYQDYFNPIFSLCVHGVAEKYCIQCNPPCQHGISPEESCSICNGLFKI